MMSANQAVVVRAALQVASSLDLRAAIARRSEDAALTRKSDTDFEAIRARLAQQLTSLVEVAKNQTPADFPMFILSNPTDPVTNQ